MPKSGRQVTPQHRLGFNNSGVHFLTDQSAIYNLVHSFRLGPQDLVLDLGAGPGAITAPLARTGARVIAVERDSRFINTLQKRFAEYSNVRVLAGDLRTIPLPHKSFDVIASIPYAVSTALLRRLLSPASLPFGRASLIVEWGFAKRITAKTVRDKETAWWNARFQVKLVKRIPPTAFSPQPKTDSAQLTIQRSAKMSVPAQRALWFLLDSAYRDPTKPVQHALRVALAGRKPRPTLAAHGIDINTAAGLVPPRCWVSLAMHLGQDRSMAWPKLPRKLQNG